MKRVTPQVHLIAETGVDVEAINDYLNSVGADEYEVPDVCATDALTEVAGKICYRAWQPLLNPNISMVRKDNAKYIENIHKSGHGSVTEHSQMTFVFHNVSRVFTHELVRHRLSAFSQESLRYVRLTDLSFWMPTILKELDNEAGEGQALIYATINHLETVQKRLAEIYKVDDKEMHVKKLLTSGFRRVAPIGLATGIVWSGNMRTLRHVIQMRTSRFAEEEIRMVFHRVAELACNAAPHMFADFKPGEIIDGIPEWSSPNAAMPYDGEKLKAKDKRIAELEQLLADTTGANIKADKKG